jgi:hypothetical protein
MIPKKICTHGTGDSAPPGHVVLQNDISFIPKDSQHTLPCRWVIRTVGGGVQLGPLSMLATNWPIVPAPVDYDDGEFGGMIGRGNRSTRRKPALVPLCPPQIPHDLTRHEPRLPRGKPETNRLSYGMASADGYVWNFFGFAEEGRHHSLLALLVSGGW